VEYQRVPIRRTAGRPREHERMEKPERWITSERCRVIVRVIVQRILRSRRAFTGDIRDKKRMQEKDTAVHGTRIDLGE